MALQDLPVRRLAAPLFGLLLAAAAPTGLLAQPATCTTAQYDTLCTTQSFCAAGKSACAIGGVVSGCFDPTAPNPCTLNGQPDPSAYCSVTSTAPWIGDGCPRKEITGTSDRTLTLANQCSASVWWGYTGGAVSDASFASGTNTCTTDADCPGSTVCSNGQSPNQCYWKVGDDTAVTPTEIATGASTTVTLDLPMVPQIAPTGPTIKWSGNVWAAQGCAKPEGKDYLVCASTNCDPVKGCSAFQAPSGIHALAEFTLQADAQDFYDISAIPGYTVPVAMGPTAGQSLTPAPASPGNGASPESYWCTDSGSDAAQGALSACTWSADISAVTATVPKGVTNALLTLVAPIGVLDQGFAAKTCTTSSDCAGQATGTTCGLWAELDTGGGYGPTGSVLQVCGTPAGMVTPNGYCALAPGSDDSPAPAPWSCNTASGLTGVINGEATNGLYENLYACNGINHDSGYGTDLTQPAANVCGCQNWDFGSPLPVTQNACKHNGDSWQSIARWGAEAVKRACPSAYSFPYDDETSTFNCETPLGDPTAPTVTANAANYTITFCPGGVAGGVAQ